MHPDLRPYFDHVWPLFWPWLIWNLLRVADWHTRTGQDGLFMVDCFGNVRLVRLSDAPEPDDLYSYEAPKQMPWERLAPDSKPLSLGRGVGVRGHGVSARAALAETPLPLIPNPFSPRRRGLSALVRGPPSLLSSFDFAQDESRTPAALMLSEVEA